jgi:putative membrane protein insertion efficiency factor
MKKILIFLIELYRKYISPLKSGPTCKYTPTCSQYAIEALSKYGFIKGSLLSIWRILRCNPFSKGGYDPVP